MKRLITIPALILTFCAVNLLYAQEVKDVVISSSMFDGMKFRSIGPAFTSGRIAAFAVDPKNRAHYYVAVASGGVWKTENDGTSWTPVFEHEGSYSIGAVAIDPDNFNIVWVGTGENNSQRSVGYGDGVYKSEDGGKTWKNMGLTHSEHIGRILIDPRNPNIIYVASQGPLWAAGGDRGLYKSTDGGKTWNCVLRISENTGVTDVEMDPTNPDILYAASYQRRRHVWTLIDGGPESAIYKSTDAGQSWTKLKEGLPDVDLGKIGLAVSPVSPNVLYATIEAADHKGGIFRSTDYGVSWERMNDFDQTAMYYGTIYADPKDVNRIYVMNTLIQVSDDGGKTLHPLGEKWKHVDSHAMWIDPKDTDYYLVGCDGGIYESYDRGKTWSFKSNLPVTQFYDVTVDNSYPFYHVYGGTQDNNSVGGPSQTFSASGIVNSDWYVTAGGDGFHSSVDPVDPDIVYSESQYGGLVRYNRATGQIIGIQPVPSKGEAPLRWNWDSPLIISPFSHTTLYFAANKLFKSTDRGNSWTEISGDLTRQLDRNKLKVMGKIWNVDAVAKNASTSFYGNCTALSESPLKKGMLYVGTDDGLIQVTQDDGHIWRKIEKFPGVPEMTYVSRVLASQHDVNTVYAAFDNHKNGDFKPYILKSTDAGKTWSSISSNLPDNGPVLAIAEDFVDPDLLFVGTEFGLFFTVNGGKSWTQLKGGLPTIPVRDIAIQKRETDLVLATFGRGIYILDNYTPLRYINEAVHAEKAFLFPVKDALMFIRSYPLGGGGKASQGENYFTADNPPFGATFTYYLKESLKTQKEIRREAEAKAEKEGITIPYPTSEQLTKESEEPNPAIVLVISDSSGQVVRQLYGPVSSGIHRVTWDLRAPSRSVDDKPISAREGKEPSGEFVTPGKYCVKLYQLVDGNMTALTGQACFNVVPLNRDSSTFEERVALARFQKKVLRLQGAINNAIDISNKIKDRLSGIVNALHQTQSDVAPLLLESYSLDTELDSILISLRGNVILQNLNENTPLSIRDRINTIIDNESMATGRPTQTDVDSYEIAKDEFNTVLSALKNIVDTRLPALEKKMHEAGSPLVPGQMPTLEN